MVGQIGRLPRCQVPGCRARVGRAVEIELPMVWEASVEYTVLSVTVGACRRHGHDLDRRARALLAARADLPPLLTIIEAAIATEQRLCEELAAARAEAAQAAGAEPQPDRRPVAGSGGRAMTAVYAETRQVIAQAQHDELVRVVNARARRHLLRLLDWAIRVCEETNLERRPPQ